MTFDQMIGAAILLGILAFGMLVMFANWGSAPLGATDAMETWGRNPSNGA